VIWVQAERSWIAIDPCRSNEGNEYLGMGEVQAVGTESGFDACMRVSVGNLQQS